MAMPGQKLLASEREELGLQRIVSFLDLIAGRGQGRWLLDRLLDTDDVPTGIASEIAKSSAFGNLYKAARTVDIMSTERKQVDPRFVGVADLDPHLPFNEQFERFFLPRLGRRADGFAAIFKAFQSHHERPFIIETGCLRIPGNWDGDGQSSFMFDALVRDRHGVLLSIDEPPKASRRRGRRAARLRS